MAVITNTHDVKYIQRRSLCELVKVRCNDWIWMGKGHSHLEQHLTGRTIVPRSRRLPKGEEKGIFDE